MISRRTILQSILSIPFIGYNPFKIIGYGWCSIAPKCILSISLPKTNSRITFPGKFNPENRSKIQRLFNNPNSAMLKELGWKNPQDIKEYEVMDITKTDVKSSDIDGVMFKWTYKHVFQMEKNIKGVCDVLWSTDRYLKPNEITVDMRKAKI